MSEPSESMPLPPNPMNDLLFKHVFGSPENKDVLLAFLNSVLGPPDGPAILDLEYVDRSIDPRFLADKGSCLDILVKTAEGRQVNVEVQISDPREMERRTLFYWAGLYHGQLTAGQRYQHLVPAVTVNLLGYESIPDEPSYHHAYELRERRTGRLLNHDLEIHFLEVPKVLKTMEHPHPALQRWLLYLSGINGEPLEEIAMSEPMIKKALNSQELYLRSKDHRRIYELREKALMDQRSAIWGAHQDGLAEGLAKGVAEGLAKGVAEGLAKGVAEGLAKGVAEGRLEQRAEIVRRLKARGLDPTAIAELLGIEATELEQSG